MASSQEGNTPPFDTEDKTQTNFKERSDPPVISVTADPNRLESIPSKNVMQQPMSASIYPDGAGAMSPSFPSSSANNSNVISITDNPSKTNIIKITTKPTATAAPYMQEIVVPKENARKNISHCSESLNKKKPDISPINISMIEEEAISRDEESNKQRSGDSTTLRSANKTETPGIKIITRDPNPQLFIYPNIPVATAPPIEQDFSCTPPTVINQETSPKAPKEVISQHYFNGDINFIATSHYNLKSTLPYDVMPTQAAINTAASGMGHVFPTHMPPNTDINIPTEETGKGDSLEKGYKKCESEVRILTLRRQSTEDLPSDSAVSLSSNLTKSGDKRASQVRMFNFSTESNLDQLSESQKCKSITKYQTQKQQIMQEKARRYSEEKYSMKAAFPGEKIDESIYSSCPDELNKKNEKKKLDKEHQRSMESLYTKFEYDNLSKHSETTTRNLNAFPSQLSRTAVHVRTISNFVEDSFEDSGYEYLDKFCPDGNNMVADSNVTYRKLPPPRRENNPHWCECSKCWSSANGSVCCTKYTELSFLSNKNCDCVTESLIFKQVVLSKIGIMYGDWMGKKLFDSEGSSTKLFRHLAYNMFVSLVSSNIRKHWSNKSLPSCVVGAIREKFPEKNAEYTGSVKSI